MEPSQEGEQATSTSTRPQRTVTRTVAIPDVSFRSVLSRYDPPRVHWSALDGLELVGTGAAARIETADEDRFETVRSIAADLFSAVDHEGPPATRPRFVGGFSFDPDRDPSSTWAGFPAASFVLPQVQVTRTDEGTWLSVTACGDDVTVERVEERLDRVSRTVRDLPQMQPSNGQPGVRSTAIRPSKRDWTEIVDRTVDRIRANDLRKVVLATAMDVTLCEPIDIPAVLERLRRTYPSCYRFLVQPDGNGSFFGPPPERLVRKRGRTVLTEALAGSVPRGSTPEEDDDHARSLFEDRKLQHEQELVADAIADALGPFGDLTVGEQTVRKLTNIQHLHTPIDLDLQVDAHVLDLVEALHPTPAVGGLPQSTAMATIRDVEPFDRGWYAAPVGWFDADGDGEFAVGIRSGVARETDVTLFAGNGIVADSDPDDEWDEIQPKYRPILDELE